MVVVAGAARVRGAGAGAGRGWVGQPAVLVWFLGWEPRGCAVVGCPRGPLEVRWL